jgi:hypothetical protein
MKPTLLLALVVLAATAAEDAADRTAIARVVTALNDVPTRATLFSADAEGTTVVTQLLKDTRSTLGPAVATARDMTVVISHEPWREAQIIPQAMASAGSLVNPRIECGAIRFITSEVALADAAFIYKDGDRAEITPLLLVLRRTVEWRIVSVRALAGQASPAAR